MFRGLLHGWQDRAGDFAFLRSGRSITIGHRMSVSVGLSLVVAFDFFLQQAQIQLAQGIGTQTAGIVGGFVANYWDLLEVIADATEADGRNSIYAQCLEEQKRFERAVRCRQARHVEAAARGRDGCGGSEKASSNLSTTIIGKRSL
jgi:hypothetical protein